MTPLGERIRRARQARGYSQGDLESRTGLLRCYLSRENGHTEPSLQTLARLSAALEMPIAGFFTTPDEDAAAATAPPSAPALGEAERSFLAEMRNCARTLNETERDQVLALARKMAKSSAKSPVRGD